MGRPKPELNPLEKANMKIYEVLGLASEKGPIARGPYDERARYEEANGWATENFNVGIKNALRFVMLPIIVVSFFVMMSGGAGTFVGGFFFFGVGLMALVLAPVYFLCEEERKHRAFKEADRRAAMATARKIACEHDKNRHLRNRVHMGGRVYLHEDGVFRDDRCRRLPPDDPKVREHLDKRGEDGS